jgi:hypothetical protein
MYQSNKSASGWKNVKGSSDLENCSHGSWKEHWRVKTGKSWPPTCSVKDCFEMPTDGGHVSNPDVEGYRIVPLCKSHNNPNNTSSFELKNTAVYCSAKKD